MIQEMNMKMKPVSRETIFILVSTTLDKIIKDRKGLYAYWWNPKFRKYLKKNKEKIAELITNEIRIHKASQSRNKVIHIMQKMLDIYEKKAK